MRWTEPLKKVLVVAILLAPFGFLFPHLNEFAFLTGSAYSDLAISHYPNAVYLLRSLAEWRQLPLWSDAILGGYPFAADPLSGLWYLPGWLAYVFPLPLGFNLDLILHLVWGGVGTFCFLRWEGRSGYAALAGGLIFELFAKTAAHFGAGHVTLVYSVAWTPWLFLVETHFYRDRKMLLAGVVLGLAALADVRWAAFLGAAWAVYALFLQLDKKRQAWTRFALRIGLTIVVGLGLACVLLVPLWEFVRLSSRAGLTVSESLAYSLPLSNLAGLVIPGFNVNAEWVIYPGGVALVLALFSLSLPGLRRKNVFWIGVVLASLLIAVGSSTPLGAFIFQLPGFDLLRVPSRVIFLLGWGMAVLAADCFDFLLALPPRVKGEKQPGNGLLIAAVSGFLLLISGGLWGFVGEISLSFFWGALVTTAVTALVLLRRSLRLPDKAWIYLILGLICLDLGGVDYLNLRFEPASVVLEEGQAEAAWIAGQDQAPFRVYSPSYSLPQQVAASAGLELADGIAPLQLQAYSRFMEKADGVAETGYSVTLPPFATGTPQIDNRKSLPSAGLLGLLNVHYVVSAFPIDAPGLELASQVGMSWIYALPKAQPRAWIQAAGSALDSDAAFKPVDELTLSPNRITVRTSQAGQLVLAELAYPGWTARLDGNPVPLTAMDGLFRSVALPAGSHVVEFDFEPFSVYLGLGLSALSWIGVALSLLWKGKKAW